MTLKEAGISEREVIESILDGLSVYTDSYREAIEFFIWLSDNHWQPYDSDERWVNNDKQVLLVKTLYQLFSNQIG